MTMPFKPYSMLFACWALSVLNIICFHVASLKKTNFGVLIYFVPGENLFFFFSQLSFKIFNDYQHKISINIKQIYILLMAQVIEFVTETFNRLVLGQIVN